MQNLRKHAEPTLIVRRKSRPGARASAPGRCAGVGNRARLCGKLKVVGLSFDQVFEDEYRPLHRYLYRRIGSADADDLAAETFAVAYRRWDDLDLSRPVRPWLYGIAANLLRHRWRTERRILRAYAHYGSDSALGQEDDSSLDRVDAQGAEARFGGSACGLRPQEREVLLLHAWADLTDAAISEALSLADRDGQVEVAPRSGADREPSRPQRAGRGDSRNCERQVTCDD